MSWDPALYGKFMSERTRPAMDLTSRLSGRSPSSVIDVGCGPGNSTAILASMFPGSDVLGIDSSPEMLESARRAHPDIRFDVMDARDIPGGWDVIFSNSCLQWIPGHRDLLPELMSKLNPGGVLAVQMPINGLEPLSMVVEETAAEPRWDYGGPRPRRFELLSPEEYYDVLIGCSSSVEMWTTTYHHVMESLGSMVEWVKGTRLRPYLELLSVEDGEALVAEILERLPGHYSPRADGRYLLRYERLFLVAERRSVRILVADQDDRALGVLDDVIGDAAEDEPVQG